MQYESRGTLRHLAHGPPRYIVFVSIFGWIIRASTVGRSVGRSLEQAELRASDTGEASSAARSDAQCSPRSIDGPSSSQATESPLVLISRARALISPSQTPLLYIVYVYFIPRFLLKIMPHDNARSIGCKRQSSR